ncbi:hypothetical protein, variant [Allomyces macrogynus ATCC 38327]|uniref:Uncharacterized protein n=1 Tax=Allomyces macrogynus (strain ATCC 38327) TaxID=578462 RepID=A0A0L0SH29_ALLM3|nr:hypothetical protein, variant [Allomyces macrogynus ATCC 38327]|eukprot:KNE61811.1 hypothetical protein, variant [Allomyces macrogynus ATCC 38327]
MSTNHPPSPWTWPPAPAGSLPTPVPAVPAPVNITIPGAAPFPTMPAIGAPALTAPAPVPAPATTMSGAPSSALTDSANATVLIAVRVHPSDPAVHVCEPIVLTPSGATIPLQALLQDKTHPLPPSAITLLHLLSAVPLQLADAVRAMGADHVVDPAVGKWFEPYLRLERPSAAPTAPTAPWPMQVPGLWPAPGLPSASMPGLLLTPGLLSAPATALPIPVPGTHPFLPTGNDYTSFLTQLQGVQGVPPGPAPVPAPEPHMAPAVPVTTAAAPALLQPPSVRVSPPARVLSPKRAPTPRAPERASTPARAPERTPTPRAPERAPTPRAPERAPTPSPAPEPAPTPIPPPKPATRPHSPAKTITEERMWPTSIMSRIRDPKDVARPAPAREQEETVQGRMDRRGRLRSQSPVAAESRTRHRPRSSSPDRYWSRSARSPDEYRPRSRSRSPLRDLRDILRASRPTARSPSRSRSPPAAPATADGHSSEPPAVISAPIPAPASAPVPIPAPAPQPSSSAPTDLRVLLKPQRTSIKFIARVFPPHKPLPERWLEKVRLALSFFVTGGVHAVQWTARDVFTFDVKPQSRIVERVMELSTMTISGHWVTMTPEDPAELPTDAVLLQRLQVPRALYVLANLPVTRLLVDLRDFIESRGIGGRLDMVGSPFRNCAWRYGYFTLARECTVEPTVFDGVEFMGRRMVVRRIENPEQFFAVDNTRPLLDAIVPLCDNQW